MKKQIFILVFLLLAIFASVTRSYGQTCTDDALHPIAGKEYTYSVTLGALPAFTDVTYDWFVTTSPNLVGATVVAAGTGTTFSVNTTGGSAYNAATGGTALIKITWTPELIAAAIGGTKYYIAVKYTGTSAAACAASNIKAYKVKPINLFQLDLAIVDASDAVKTDGYTICPSDIASTTITDDGTNATIAYDYGTNDLFVKVTVKNFTGDWKLSVNHSELAALVGTGETFALAWGTTIALATNAITDDNDVTIAEQTVTATDNEVIYLKLTYDHNTFEGLAAKAVAIKVNAKDKANNPDVSATCTADADMVTQNIGARPGVASNTLDAAATPAIVPFMPLP